MKPTTARTLNKALTICIALVWLGNGLLCKVLNLVPRHQEIVSTILGADYAWLFTKAIGVSEILVAIWIVSGIKPRWCAAFQILIVASMNTLEFILVPHLLLWGKLNSVFALLFIVVVYINGFILPPAKPINAKA
ncbi:MAG: DoxX-like family protein [Sphingobacteriales bacterium JAD_PAG50586_3]|nr:MAG: DoxX-like family protein [Sphingobacteriales bacterium JAD_PAG50586_3]